jgi:Flp pilus assembly protein TadG
LATPFVLLALFGSIDIVRYLQIQESLIRAVNTSADAIARQNGITTTEVFSFLGHAADTIDPDSSGGSAIITVASVHKDGTNAAEVAWRRDKLARHLTPKHANWLAPKGRPHRCPTDSPLMMMTP